MRPFAAIVLAGRSLRGAQTIAGGSSVGPAPDAPTQLVATGGSGQITLSWTAPALNADGSAVSIDHYLVYVGTTPGEQHNGGSHMGGASPFSVPAGTLTKTVTGLAAGTWYLGASTVNSSGLEGNGSAEVSGVVT